MLCYLVRKSWQDSRFSFLLLSRCHSSVLDLLEPPLLPLFVPHSQTQGQQQHNHPRTDQDKRHGGRFIFPVTIVSSSSSSTSCTAAAISGFGHRYHAPHNHHNAEGNKSKPQSAQCILGSRVYTDVTAAVVVVIVAGDGASSAERVWLSIHTWTHLVSCSKSPQASCSVVRNWRERKEREVRHKQNNFNQTQNILIKLNILNISVGTVQFQNTCELVSEVSLTSQRSPVRHFTWCINTQLNKQLRARDLVFKLNYCWRLYGRVCWMVKN